MRRLLLAAVAVTLAAAAPARGAVSVGGEPEGLLAMTVAGGTAYAIVASGDPRTPLALVRSTGGIPTLPEPFGDPRAEFPDVASGPNGVVVSWGRPISNGDRYVVSAAPPAPGGLFGPAQTTVAGTGPGRLALGPAGEALLAYPDGQGDATLLRADGIEERLTASAPELRHLPLDLAVDAEGRAFVLELVQTPGHSELRLLGPGAPAAPIVGVDALRDLRGTLAVDGQRVYVAFQLNGRMHLSIAALDPAALWWNRRLPGRGGGAGAPAVLRSAGQTFVVFTQRQRHGRGEVFLTTEGTNPLSTRRLTRTRADERIPFVAAGAGGEVFAGWSRGVALRGPSTAVISRLR